MRILLILGAIFVGGGLYIVLKAPTYSREETVLKIGDVEAKMQREHEVPAWLGGVGIGAGLVLIVVGLKAR